MPSHTPKERKRPILGKPVKRAVRRAKSAKVARKRRGA